MMDPTRRSTMVSCLTAVEPAAVGVVPARPGTGSPVVLVLIMTKARLMIGQLFRGERGRLSESWIESGLP